MDIYLTAKSTGERLRFPLVPDRVSIKTGALPVSFQIIKLGEVKIPRGNSLTGYTWNGVFPGESMSGASFIFDWQEPNRIIELLKGWESKGETLSLMVTETTINDDVFIENFTFEHYGIDNVSYTLNLTKRAELVISTNPPSPSETSADGTQVQHGTVRTNGGNLHVRKGPGTEYEILGKLPNGTRVDIVGKSGNWYIINYGDGTAYVSASYVQLDGSGSTASSTSKKSSSSSSKKSSTSKSSNSTKKTTSSAKSSTSNTATKKTLTISKPKTTLINIAKSAVVKQPVTKVSSTTASKRISAIAMN